MFRWTSRKIIYIIIRSSDNSHILKHTVHVQYICPWKNSMYNVTKKSWQQLMPVAGSKRISNDLHVFSKMNCMDKSKHFLKWIAWINLSTEGLKLSCYNAMFSRSGYVFFFAGVGGGGWLNISRTVTCFAEDIHFEVLQNWYKTILYGSSANTVWALLKL